MRGLIQTESLAIRQPELSHKAPLLLTDWRSELDALGLQPSDFCFHIRAHQEKLFAVDVRIGGMNPDFSGRRLEHEPTASGIHAWEFQDVTKELANRLGILAVENRVHSADHRVYLLGPPEHTTAASCGTAR